MRQMMFYGMTDAEVLRVGGGEGLEMPYTRGNMFSENDGRDLFGVAPDLQRSAMGVLDQRLSRGGRAASAL